MESKKYYQLADHSYQKFTPAFLDGFDIKSYIQENNESILNFLEQYQEQFGQFRQGGSLLETGCGLAGIAAYFAKKGLECTGIDQSPLAISLSKDIFNKEYTLIELLNKDLCRVNADKKYDYIVDSHLLHCLIDKSDREAYLSYVFNSLNDNGFFFLETMCFHNRIQTPVGYSIDSNGALYKEETPYRKLVESIELEEELKSIGFKIKYLYFHNELSFDVFPEYRDYPFEYLPKTLRIVLTR